jgi:hypothetical protein
MCKFSKAIIRDKRKAKPKVYFKGDQGKSEFQTFWNCSTLLGVVIGH